MASRDALVAEARAYLQTHGWPRLQTALILAGAGGAAFATSVVALAAGLDGMALRYGVATLAGYLAFLGLIRLWIAWYRHGLSVDDVGTFDLDAAVPRGGSSAGEVLFAGGRSGGGGGGAVFESGSSPFVSSGHGTGVSTGGRSSGFSFGDLFDGEEAWAIVVALLLVAGGVMVLGYVVYLAPVLLAEVALDAALMGGLYRRLRKDDARHWSRGLVRSTWVPALLIAACACGAGYFAQRAVPEARSIGGVVRALTTDAAR